MRKVEGMSDVAFFQERSLLSSFLVLCCIQSTPILELLPTPSEASTCFLHAMQFDYMCLTPIIHRPGKNSYAARTFIRIRGEVMHE